MSTTILTTGGQIPGTSRRERRCVKNASFVKARATAWVIRKTRRATEKMELRAGPLKRSDCKRVTLSARGWKSRELACPGDELSLSGREAATLLVCLGISAICKADDKGKGSRPSTMVTPRPKSFRRVSPQGECHEQRRLLARIAREEERWKVQAQVRAEALERRRRAAEEAEDSWIREEAGRVQRDGADSYDAWARSGVQRGW